MNEWTLQILAFSKLIVASCCAFLYGIGGMTDKAIRRYLVPILLAIFIWIFSSIETTRNYLYFIYPLLLCGAFHLGYGGNDTLTKIKKRFIYGLACGISAITIPIFINLWLLYWVHLALCILLTIIFGVWNPFKSARDEETCLGFFYVVIPLFMI